MQQLVSLLLRFGQSPKTFAQLEEVQAHLDAHPIKVPIRTEGGGGRAVWEPSAQAVEDEARRTVLREAESRYRHEIMGHDERLMLEDRIRRLHRQLGSEA
jgi:hypothetical protein